MEKKVKLEELINRCEEKGQLSIVCYGKGKYVTRIGYFIESTPEQKMQGYPQMMAHCEVEAPYLDMALFHLLLALTPPKNTK